MASAAAPFRTPRRRRPSRTDTPPSEKKRLNGLWQGGHWWCNCEPRKKARLLEVVKNTPNKGKFFWACPSSPYCNFFLWRHEALVREAGHASAPEDAAAAGAPEELPPPPPKTPALTQRPLTSFGVQVTPGRAPSPSPLPGAKRSRRASERASRSDGEFSDFGSDEERQLATMADDDGSTAAGLPSPSVARTLFPEPAAKRLKTVSFEARAPCAAGPPTPRKTPSAGRRDAPPPGSPPDAGLDVADDVMALLRAQALPAAALAAVEDLLATAARRVQGVVRGRDLARAALRQRDDAVAALRERVAALESNERSLDRQLTGIKSELMRIYQGN